MITKIEFDNCTKRRFERSMGSALLVRWTRRNDPDSADGFKDLVEAEHRFAGTGIPLTVVPLSPELVDDPAFPPAGEGEFAKNLRVIVFHDHGFSGRFILEAGMRLLVARGQAIANAPFEGENFASSKYSIPIGTALTTYGLVDVDESLPSKW